MFRVTSLTKMDDRQLSRWIKRIALILVAGTVLFTGFYVLDRWRAPTTPIVDRRLSALEQAVRDDPEDIVSRGSARRHVRRQGPLRRRDRPVQRDPRRPARRAELATFGRAAAYMGLEQYDLAAKDYERVVEIAKDGEMANVDPTLQAAYYSLGSIAMKQGRPADAIPFLEKALAIKRSDADALYLIGTAYVATGETDKAEIALRAAVAFVPIGWSEPYTAMAEAFTKAGRTAMAAVGRRDGRPCRRTSRTSPNRASSRSSTGTPRSTPAIGLGLLFETKGDTASAAEWYGRPWRSGPENAAARIGLSRVGPGGSALPALPTPGTPGGETD